MQPDLDHLFDILESALVIQEYADDVEDLQALALDRKTRDAIIRRFEIVGEAANRVSDAFQARHPEVPWAKMRGMRNLLIHQYDSIVLPIVWEAVQISIPELLAQLKPFIPNDYTRPPR